MGEHVRRTGRRCEVRVHEQIRRNTGPAERVHTGSPETEPAEAGSQRLGGSRIPHVAGKRLETPQNVLPPTRPGSNARMLVPETMVGRGGCAASSPPQPLRRDRDLSSFRRESVRAARRGFAGRSSELMTAAKRPRAPVDPGPRAEHRPSPGTSSSTQIISANSSALIAMERTH
jgi:hypothetical protein